MILVFKKQAKEYSIVQFVHQRRYRQFRWIDSFLLAIRRKTYVSGRLIGVLRKYITIYQ